MGNDCYARPPPVSTEPQKLLSKIEQPLQAPHPVELTASPMPPSIPPNPNPNSNKFLSPAGIQPSKNLAKLPPFEHDLEFEQQFSSNETVKNLTMSDGIYSGQLKNGLKHGFGTFLLEDGSMLEGYWLNDKMSHRGRFLHECGDYYSGQWKDGKVNGKGMYQKNDGSKYEGDWVDDEQHGKGRETFPDGAYYEGDFFHNKKKGKGISVSESNEKYEGAFDNDNFNGHGVLTWANGHKYDGEWVNSKRDGKGIMYLPDGTEFHGSYKQNLKHGTALIKMPNGKQYETTWDNGNRVGPIYQVDERGNKVLVANDSQISLSAELSAS